MSELADIGKLVRKAWRVGQDFDLSGIGYGRIHWGDKKEIKQSPSSYYYLLAGLAKETCAKNAIEIGTHYGGSTIALCKGMESSEFELSMTTIDITKESDNFLPQFEEYNITKIVGDANGKEVIEQISNHCSQTDLLYIDAAHTMTATLANFSIYQLLFKPKIIIIDDINLNEEMRAFWKVISNRFGPQALNVSTIIPQARDVNCGFGVVLR